jgi:hypothetical protein
VSCDARGFIRGARDNDQAFEDEKPVKILKNRKIDKQRIETPRVGGSNPP